MTNEQMPSVPYHSVKIYIGGVHSIASVVCGEYCRKIGFCVNVTPTEYIYSGGQETGVIVEKINYARFPSTIQEDCERMKELADLLAERMNQRSYTITHNSRLLNGSSYHTVSMPCENNRKI